MPGTPLSFFGALRGSAVREAARLRASPWDLALISWVPLLAAALIWWIFSAGLPTRLPIGVQDDDHSALSRQLVRMLDAAPGLAVAERYADAAATEAALRRTEVYAVVQIPRDFSRDLKQGRAAAVTLLHNAQLGTHSGLIQRDVRTVAGTLSAGIEIGARTKRGDSALAARAAQEPIRANTVTLFNTSSNYEQFLAAALIPALLHILAMTAGAWAVGRELRDGTVGEWLGTADPGRGPTSARFGVTLGALLGKLLWPMAGLGTVAALALLWLTAGRGWHPAGSLAWTLFALEVFLALSIALGALAAALTRSLRTALSATGFITAPAFAFGGVGFPIVAMPWLAQCWARALPYTHYARVQIEQLQMAAPLRHSLATPLWMAVALLLMLATSTAFLARAAGEPASWGKR